MLSQYPFDFVTNYWVDAWQRSILALDVLRERGDIYLEHNAKNAPNVLKFDAELVTDGRMLPRPVNYVLARILPQDNRPADPTMRPFIVVDPRAGHGPGIGGMKQDSEIGVAMAAGHPCYFIGFLPNPEPGQTVEDVCIAEARFIETVAARHPQAEGKPAVIGNCQAGWQLMLTAALAPDLMGPIVLAGSPLSYWAGVRGKNPLRYLGGVLGGTWLTALAGDIGKGIFDGANLVSNFESLNPANTYWEKPYGLYSKVDSEAERFLDFETWWGSPVLLNAEEMQWIADNLFVGNKLAAGEITASSGRRVDLRNIKSPIIVFCSWGDNITPPQQALGWITDLYDHERDIVTNGQTIVYTTHQTIGHLGIFVSGKVASKEHAEFANCMDMIDLLPPGLYEAVITEVDEQTANPALIEGKYLFRLETRTLDDIRAFGGNDEADERRFATAARLSELNLGLYRNFMQPFVRAMATDRSAEAMRELHPSRLRFAAFAESNPLMKTVKGMAQLAREGRQPVSADNPLLAVEQMASTWISTALDSYRVTRDTMTEMFFVNLYGSPILQAMVGVDGGTKSRPIAPESTHETPVAKPTTELDARFETGSVTEAIIRALIYIRIAGRTVDERGFSILKAVRSMRPAAERLHLAELKGLFRDQFLLVKLDEERAVAAIPKLLPDSREQRQSMLDLLQRVVQAHGDLTPDEERRLRRVESLFGGISLVTPTKESARA